MPTDNQPHTVLNAEDQAQFDALKSQAMALPADAVKAPDLPVAVFLDEGRRIVAAGREHQSALLAVGMPDSLLQDFAQRLQGLDAAQLLWSVEQNRGRARQLRQCIEQAYELRADTLAAGDLALRNSPDGQRRLGNIREGDGLADLVADLSDLACLLRDTASLFAAIKATPDEMAAQLERTASELRLGLAQEQAHKSVAMEKELRDRYFTLCLEPLRELRAFADFAFRKDTSHKRRTAFTSAYTRRRDRRAARARKAAKAAAAASAVLSRDEP